MVNRNGFTLVELLISLSIVGILAVIALVQYHHYFKNVVKTHLIADIRHCLQEIAVNLQFGDIDIQQVVSSCSKSKYTNTIELVSTDPIQLKATGRVLVEEISCSYDEQSGSISCNFD